MECFGIVVAAAMMVELRWWLELGFERGIGIRMYGGGAPKLI
jgi:hypothetical protein